MSYIDGFVLPLPNGKEEEYRNIAQTFAEKAEKLGAIASVEAIGDGLEHGHTTDFYRAVKAEDGETVVFSFIEWPDKKVRDDAWAKIMADESMKPDGEMPFSGQRMFWGGFEPILDSAAIKTTENA